MKDDDNNGDELNKKKRTRKKKEKEKIHQHKLKRNIIVKKIENNYKNYRPLCDVCVCAAAAAAAQYAHWLYKLVGSLIHAQIIAHCTDSNLNTFTYTQRLLCMALRANKMRAAYIPTTLYFMKLLQKCSEFVRNRNYNC